MAGLAAAGAGLTACAGTGGGTGGGSGTGTGTGTGGGSVTSLEFWSNHPGNSKEVETALIKKFQDANPGLTVKLVDAGKNYEEVAQKLNGALAGGQLPDAVVLSDVTWFNFALNKQLEPVDDLLSAAKLSSGDYVDSLYSDYKNSDKHYALPFARSTPLFYYHKEMWAKAGLPDRGPKTWDEFAEWAPKLAQAAGADKSSIVLADGSNYLDWYFQGMAWSMGGAYSDGWDLKFTDAKTIAAGEFLKKMFAQKWARAAKQPSSDFSAGTAACLLESTGALGGIAKNAKFAFGTAFLPSPDGVKGCPTGGAGIGIPAKISSERKAAAIKFVEFLTNPENTVTFTQATGYMPVRKSALELAAEKDFMAKNPNAKTAIEQLPRTKSQDNARVFVPGGGMRVGKALDQIAQGGDVKAVFEALQKETQTVIDRDIKPKL